MEPSPDLVSDSHVLVIESDPAAGSELREELSADGFRVALASSAQHARSLVGVAGPMLVVLGGLELPRAGLAMLGEIRSGEAPWSPCLPVIVIGPSARELDMLRAFEHGADDYLPRPFQYIELRARLRALLRRARQDFRTRLLRVGTLTIDLNARTVTVGAEPVELRRLEFELLCHLAHDPERVFGAEDLLRVVWGYRARCATRTIDSHASRLRRKLLTAGAGSFVINVRGVGYRLI